MRIAVCLLSISLAGGLAISGCTSAGIALREQFGIRKAEQLVDRVEDARDAQNAAKEQFQSALDEFMSVTGQTGKGGSLETQYKKLQGEYDRCEARAATVKSRIDTVETVASKLFSEWQSELGQYQDANLRSMSERQLNDSKARYAQMLAAMKNAESRMAPVLNKFKDNVLFLKHNLNAQAIAGLQGTVVQIQGDVAGLVRDMEAAIAEANRFIEQTNAAAKQ
jgi:hypothetical protein